MKPEDLELVKSLVKKRRAYIEAVENWVRKRGFLFETGDSNLPRADMRRDGVFKVRLVRLSKAKHVEQTVVTGAGLVWLRHRWLAKRHVDAAASAKAAKEAGQDLFGNVA